MRCQLSHDGLMLLPVRGERPKTNIIIGYISYQLNAKQVSHTATHSRQRKYRHHPNSNTKAGDVCAICLVERQVRNKQVAAKKADATPRQSSKLAPRTKTIWPTRARFHRDRLIRLCDKSRLTLILFIALFGFDMNMKKVEEENRHGERPKALLQAKRSSSS